MTPPPRPTPLRRLCAAVLLALPLALSAAAVGPAEAHPRRDLTVMTQNLYLGSSLQPALDAQTQEQFLTAVAQIYGTVAQTDFRTRSEALAREIADREPDLIGLQEVAEWTLTRGASTAPERLDFLEVLLDDLEDAGLSYSVAGVSDNATIGPLPLLSPCAAPPSCLLTFHDRDVILVNDDTRGLKVRRSASGLFAAQVVLPTPVGELSFDRGWTYVDAKFRGKKFRFLNTHLEVGGEAGPIQELQAAELLAGPLKPRLRNRHTWRTIAVGDFNSAADNSTTRSYALLTTFLRDAWLSSGLGPGLTCCQNDALTNATSEHSSRIDLVLTRGRVRALHSELVGDEPFQDVAPRWISDHAGVVTEVRLGGHRH